MTFLDKRNNNVKPANIPSPMSAVTGSDTKILPATNRNAAIKIKGNKGKGLTL